MQAVFFLAMFSLIFLMFSGMVAGLSQSIMQANVERVADVKRMFSEIELTLNRIAFKEVDENGKRIIDLSNPDLTDLSEDFLTRYTNFTKSQLQKDPWGNKIHLIRKVEQVAIWGDSSGQKALAPVSTFLLISAGPNERYDLLKSESADIDSPNLSLDQIKTIDITDTDKINDDIIYRFSNYGAMLDLWQQVEELDNTIKNIALEYYQKRVDAFSPLIQLAQRDVSKDGILKENVFDSLDENSGYQAFEDIKTQNDLFTNEWYKDDPSKTDDLHDILINNFRLPKTYNDEFRLDAVNSKNNKLNDEFRAKYDSREFLYPTFDILIEDKNGNPLTSDEEGFLNLGINSLPTQDPFYNEKKGMISFSYDKDNPAEFQLKRDLPKDSNKEKWVIKKNIQINALGDLS